MQVCYHRHVASTSVLRLISKKLYSFVQRAAQRKKKDKTMKKNLIYTVIFLLSGTFLFSSCEDMLNVESDRVEYDFKDWTLNDSVYSVLGILKSVQDVGDRQILLNELRADLVTISETKAVIDVQELSKSVFNIESNKYLDVKSYYAIINNCNIYLARVDTTLEKNNVKLMIPEFVAVKSIRAWTYLQLAINYNQVPYFTDPILTHSDADKVMNQPMLGRDEIISKLIADILPYENPAAFPMPAWDNDGTVLKFGYGDNGTELETKLLFVPVRMLLGEMYLWRGAAGDYKRAAQSYYDLITGAGTNSTAKKYNDYGAVAGYREKGGKNINNGFAAQFALKSFSANKGNFLAVIPFASSELDGTISQLSSIFSPQNEVGGAQVFASPGVQSLAQRQVYRYFEGEDAERPDLVEYSIEKNYEHTGDLRILSSTYSQMSDDEDKTQYGNIISKFNLEENVISGSKTTYHTPKVPTTLIVLARKEMLYLRFAEALVGMEREGYAGAMDLAMVVLKEGVKHSYPLLQNPVYDERHKILTNGDTLKLPKVDNVTGDTVYEYVMETYLASCADSVRFNFTDEAFTENKGIHSRGSGDSERNKYYALNDTCIARYLGTLEKVGGLETITVPVTYEDSVNYVADLILDELALEFAWEGTRFGDLIRFSKAMGSQDVLAKRVAGRAHKNSVSYRSPLFEYDAELYSRLLIEANWYLPLPGSGVVDPGKVEETPDDFNPEDLK